jgi:hypothetical protein
MTMLLSRLNDSAGWNEQRRVQPWSRIQGDGHAIGVNAFFDERLFH